MMTRLTIDRPAGRAPAAIGLSAVALMMVLTVLPRVAAAVPSFATQTGLPCAQCHVIAFGPSLTPYGRQFKLHGYTFKKQDSGFNIPVAVAAQVAYDSVSKAAPTPSPFSDKENLVVQSVSGYIAGGFTDHLGAFAKVTYDGVFKNTAWDKMDVRYARSFDVSGHSVVAGIDVNNTPTVQDLWNSTPVWGFPYIQSELVPFPNSAPVLAAGLGNVVLGASAYAMVDDLVYAELGFYKGMSDKWLGDLGDPDADPNLVGAAPYARIAVQKQKGANYFEVGAVWFDVKQQPFLPTTTQTNRYADFELDGTYQWNIGAPHAIDAHASWIHENRNLDASVAIGASNATSNTLESYEADVSYIMEQTWVASLGLFATTGTTNPLMFTPGPVNGSASGSPDRSGYTVQLEWVPFGKSGSFASPWVNVRLGVQYTGYWRFNGGSSNYDGFGRDASDNNSLFVFAWLAF